MKLSSTFRKIAGNFITEFDELSREITHNLSAGESREHVLIALLKKYLPSRVGVGRGFVIDAHGAESKQIDIVIYDRTVGTVFEVNGVSFFPCETVIAVGEVKSDITSVATLSDALEKLKSVKTLDRSNGGRNLPITGPGFSIQGVRFDPASIYRDQIFGFIFTSSSLAKQTLLSRIQEFNRENPRPLWMNLYCDIGKYIISYKGESFLTPSPMDAKQLYCTSEAETGDLLLLFYCILATFIDQAHVARPDYFSYASISSTTTSYHPCN
jgi:hypothetical protein